MPIDTPAGFVPDSPQLPSGFTPDAPQQSNLRGPVDVPRLGQALIHSNMLGVDPAFAYQRHDQIKSQLQEVGGDYWSDVGRAAETGVEETPLAMLIRGRAPDPFESHDLLQNFVHDVSSFASDPVFLGAAIGGSFLGGPEVGIPLAFALDAGLRKALMDHYQKGNVKSFGELTDRAAATLWAGAKGAITGEAAVLAGGLPVPGALAGSTLARFGVHALYQSAALTTVGSLLDWRVPRMEDFTRTAAVVTGLGLLSLPSEMTRANAQRALMDVYAKDGTSPAEAAARLQAQPTVEPEQAPGLRPAIRITTPDGQKAIVKADEGEGHPELAERMGQRPVTLDELEKDYQERKSSRVQPAAEQVEATQSSPKMTPEQQLKLDQHERYMQYVGKQVDELYRSVAQAKEGADATDEPGADQEAVWGKTINEQQTRVLRLAQGAVRDGRLAGRTDLQLADDLRGAGFPDKLIDYVLPETVIETKEAAPAKQLPAAPSLADKVLSQPEIHLQQVIDRAAEIKEEQGEPIPDRSKLQSGRGFTSPDGKFLSRGTARVWVKDNEPEVYDMWATVTGDKTAEFHSDDYRQARERVQNRTMAEGDPGVAAWSPQLAKFVAGRRPELNDIKAGDQSAKYGKAVLRDLFVGPRNMLRAEAEQLHTRLAKLIPDFRDQEALTFFRDYKGSSEELRAAIEEIRFGKNEKLKASIPSRERALGYLNDPHTVPP